MSSIMVIIVLSAVFGGALWSLQMKEAIKLQKKTERNAMYIIGVMLVGVAAHLIAAGCYYGHKTDMSCFTSWSSNVFNNGLSSFYKSEGLHDYPPGYVYIMYVLGALKTLFNADGTGLQIIIKLPAMIADLVMAFIVFRVAAKKYSDGIAAAFAALIALNPVTILNSSVWGQIDSILAMFCVLALYFMAEKKQLIPAFFMFAAGVLIKPQAVFIAPVIIYGIIDIVWLDGFTAKKFVKNLIGGLSAIAMMFILFMPFGSNPAEGIKLIIDQYLATVGQYNYFTVNAFNIYGAIGKNWEALNAGVSAFGYIMMAAATAYSAYVFFKSKSPAKYYISAFIVTFGFYMLAIKMHERYAFPGLFMLMFALISVPNTKIFSMFGLFSLSQFFNTAWILFIYEQDINKYYRSPVVTAASMINIGLMIFFIYVIQKECVGYKESARVDIKSKSKSSNAQQHTSRKTNNVLHGSACLRLTEKLPKLGKADIIAIAAISLVYAVIALYNLGNMYAPETETVISKGDTVMIDLGSEKNISEQKFFLGARQLEQERNLEFRYLDTNKNTVKTIEKESGSVFCWTTDDVDVNARYVQISTNATGESDSEFVYIKELCLLDNENNLIQPTNNTDDITVNLFDEQEYVTDGKSYMSGTYFDEIYHARTAYEFIHHMTVYEWTHPPLGKVMIGLGILIFGMVPFGWRIVGTVFGIFMVPAIYIFAKKLFKQSWLATVTCLLFTFDFMHYAQTRIATIDTYVTFFIILMYYFMYKYYTMSFYDTPVKKTLVPLGLSGIFFGFSVASKWTGLYAGAGLAVIFFYTLYQRYNEYRMAGRNKLGKTNGIEHKYVIEIFRKNTIITLVFCVVMFIIVPMLIYTMSYIPYFQTPSGNGLKTIFENADSMYTYHSKTVVDSTHPYSSHWFEWPVMYRPIWYFSNSLDNGLKQGISSFGNPAVWWTGIAAVAYMAALTIIIPLKKHLYYGINKTVFFGFYIMFFAVVMLVAYAVGSSNEKLVRLFPCVTLYSCVFVGIFGLTMLYEEFIKQESNRIPLFLLIAYLAGIMPWMLVVRTTYIYHYFPCVPFVVLMIGYSIKTLYDNTNGSRKIIIASFVYAAAAVILFAMFYPVLSGAPCSPEYAEAWLKWFDSWVLL